MPFKIPITDEQSRLMPNKTKIRAAVRAAMSLGGFSSGEISVALVDDEAIHKINREFLQHDYPTDVISFPLDESEGEIVVSTDTAWREAERLAFPGWTAEEEMFLYVIHGALHLAGFDDHEEEDLKEMRTAEVLCLRKIGIMPPENLHEK